MRVDSPSAAKYQRYRKTLAVVYLLLPAILLFAFAEYGWSEQLSKLLLRFAGNYYWALLIDWGVIWLGLTVVLLPVSWGWYLLERSHGLARQSYRVWIGDYCRYRAIRWITTSAGFVWFFWALRTSADYWYLLFWPATVLADALLLSFLESWFLPLFFKVSPLPSGELHDRLSSLASCAGIRNPKFTVVHVGKKTARSNALVTGLAGNYRILITDTLLETFTPEEIEAVVAHEMGHQAQHHTTKRVILLAVLYLLGLWLLQWPVRMFMPQAADIASLPYWAVALPTGRQYLLLFFGLFARRQEKSADRFSWNLTQNVPAFISMLRKLAAQNLQPTNRRYGISHPAVQARIDAAETFVKAQQAELAVSAGQPV